MSLLIFLLAGWFAFWYISKKEERKEHRYWSEKEIEKRAEEKERQRKENLYRRWGVEPENENQTE
ncbi:MAG: hypothetical protein LBT56_03705 [Prevotellaceae bacterium]|jgi:hypothetical protein|nr:hypothetical protein [Prevotellaceae bacterium]